MQNFLSELFSQLGVQLSDDALLVLVGIISAFITYLITQRLFKTRLNKLELKFQQQRGKEQSLFDDQLDQLSHTFSSLSHKALRHNNESFISLAKQSFAQLQANASNDLRTREQSFANLIKPIQQSISETDKQLKELDSNRKISEVRLGEQISNLLQTQHGLQSETRNLVTALRRPEVRGQWGEMSLKRLVELAGMSEHCDFEEQLSVSTESGIVRPDMLIHLPNNRQLVVDVKTPLDAYLSAMESNQAEHQKQFLQQHYRNVKQRIKELSQKQYWQQFEFSPDFVILFIPGDQFLSSALDQDKNLLEYALTQKILLATPTSLVGLLRTIAHGWNQDTLSKNSEQIRSTGEVLYQRLQKLTEHLNKLGRHLDQSVEQFNRLAGSYRQKAIPAAQKLSELGISNEQPLDLQNAQSQPTRKIQTDSADNDEQNT